MAQGLSQPIVKQGTNFAPNTGAWWFRLTDTVRNMVLGTRPDSTVTLETNDDYNDMQAVHATLSASTDTPITFAQTVRNVRVKNWDTSNRVLVKTSVISSDTDAAASRVGKAPAADVPNSEFYPMRRATDTLHLRSAAASEVTVEGFF